MKAVFLCVMMALLLTGCGGSSTPTPPPLPATITGTWTGNATSQVVTGTSGITGHLVQGVTNPDGSILFSGTLNLTNSCITTLTITNGKIAGGQFQLAGTSSDGTSLAISGALNAADTQITGTYATLAGTLCATDHGTATLSKQ